MMMTDDHNQTDASIGRIVSVTGAKAIMLLDLATSGPRARPEMGTLLGINTQTTVVLAIVSALSVPVPAQRDGDTEVWIAELGLVGELQKNERGEIAKFNRGVTAYPSLGDRVRVSTRAELRMAFCGDDETSVRVGAIRQDSSIPAMVKVDDLLGKHFAILGTTGTGKSCTTALILRSILNKNPAAHIVLLDPHNEYSTAFGDWGEVISPRNMQLPFWLLNFEELTEVLIGDNERKAEIEILQELIPIAKSRYSSGRGKESQQVRRGVIDPGRFTVDTPVPYRISDLTSLIDERMGKLENKRDLAPYRQVKQRIESISQDARYAFMFGSLTVYDGMTQVLSRIFRVPVAGRPITILELTGIPPEIVAVVVSVICRMTFDFALWSEGKVPVTVVCEEAHRYVPANSSLGFEPAKRAIAKIAKEGRKYGASLCIVTQRPAEIDPTILSQCNTVFALRMSNDRDQAIVQSAISDTGSGLLEFLSALGQREAIAFGDGVSLPVRIRFDEMPKEFLPRSSGAAFTKQWQHSENDEGFLEALVERWRSAGLGAVLDASQQAAQIAESLGGANISYAEDVQPVAQPAARSPNAPLGSEGRVSGIARRESISAATASGSPVAASPRRPAAVVPAPAAPAPARSLRERLMSRTS
ncbi:MAG: ATP-binding protein [Hyphomicrobiaceae bacterium]